MFLDSLDGVEANTSCRYLVCLPKFM